MLRWDRLFADLDAQLAALVSTEARAELADRTRAEAARLTMLDRLYPAVGSTVRLRCQPNLQLTGRVSRVGSQWMLLDEGTGRETLLPFQGLLSVAGLGRGSAAPDSRGHVESRLGLRHALTGVARDRSVLRVHLLDGSTVDGTIDRVGADFVELAALPPGEVRRRSSVLESLVFRTESLVALRRDG